MAELNYRVNNTGPVGVYLYTGTSSANRLTGSGATYYPLCTCESFPILDSQTQLTPVMNDLYGDAPFTHIHSGIGGTISIVTNRFSWANLIKLINSDFTASAETEASLGTQELNRAGILGARGDGTSANHAFGMYFHYGNAGNSQYSGRLPNGIVGRRYHSVMLQSMQIISAGTRQFAVQLVLKPSLALNTSGNPVMFNDLTSIPGSCTITDFACQDISTTGAIGVYGSVDFGANYTAIGHCERFPIITYTRALSPVFSDLFGDVPFDYQFMGEQTTVEMDLNRYRASALDTFLNASYASAKGQVTQTKIGTNITDNGSTLKLWMPSSQRMSTNACLVFNYGHWLRNTNTSMGSRQYKEGLIWANAGHGDCDGGTGNLNRWELIAATSEAMSDFTS